MQKRAVALFAALLFCLTALAIWPSAGLAQEPTPANGTAELTWSSPALVSGLLPGAWFPEAAVDPLGNVFVAYSQSQPPAIEYLYMSRFDGQGWSRPVDIADGRNYIVRAALAVDSTGYLHMSYSPFATASYTNARLDDATVARGWRKDRRFTQFKENYLGDIKIDSSGVIHLAFNENTATCPGDCLRVKYVQSPDGGQTWLEPVTLMDNYTNRRRLEVVLGSGQAVYVVWDNVTARAEAKSGGIAISRDGGLTWDNPIEILDPRGALTQTTLGTDGQGNLMVVYRLAEVPEIYYQLSTDDGISWSTPEQLPGVFAADAVTSFERYSMATDSAGTIYLAVSGRTSRAGRGSNLLVLAWDGTAWSAPMPVMVEARRFVEWPSLVVSEGNKLHLVWHVRGLDRIFSLPDDTYQVFYSTATTNAPRVAPQPMPTATEVGLFTPTAPAPTVTPTATRTPFVSSIPEADSAGLMPQFPVAIAVLPVLLLVGAVVVWRVAARRS
jgi:hypothetical protein